MSLGHLGLMGAVGETLALVGLALLWTYRTPAAEWLREFIDIKRGEVSGRDPQLSDPAYRRLKPRRPRGAALLIGGTVLFFIGQILLIIDLVHRK